MSDEVFFDNPEDLKMQQEILNRVLPIIVHVLLEDGILKKEDLGNKEYVSQK